MRRLVISNGDKALASRTRTAPVEKHRVAATAWTTPSHSSCLMGAARRLIVMAGLGACGALLGAVGGEALFLGAPPAPAKPARRHVCLVFDTSESMAKKTSEA